MENLYKNIRDEINNPPIINATEKDWNSFQSYREAKDGVPSKSVVWPYWAVGALLLLLGFSNGYWMIKKSNNIKVNNEHSAKIDTVYIIKYVDNTATIGESDQTQVQLEKVGAELAWIKSQYQSLTDKLNNQNRRLSQLQASKNDLETEYVLLQSQWNSNYAANNSKLASGNQSGAIDGQPSIPSLDSSLEERLFVSIIGELPRIRRDQITSSRPKVFHPSQFITIKNDRPFNLLHAIAPKTFSINTNIGYVYHPSEDGSRGFLGDLRATTLFSQTLRGYIGVTYSSVQSRIEDNLVGVPYPTLSEGDEIEHSDERLSQVAANIGLEYLINLKSRWRPFVGLGYGRVIKNNATYSFEIKDVNGNEYKIEPENGISQSGFDQVIFTLGSDFNVSSKVDMRVGLNYNHAVQNQYNSKFLFKGGVYYHF